MTCDSFRQLCTWAIRNVLPHPPPFRQNSTVSHTETYNRRTQYDESTCWANVLLLLRPSSATIGKVSLSSSARWWIVRWTRRARNSSRQRRRRTRIAKLDSRVQCVIAHEPLAKINTQERRHEVVYLTPRRWRWVDFVLCPYRRENVYNDRCLG